MRKPRDVRLVRSLALLGSLLLGLACGGDGGGPARGDTRVTLDAGHAVSQSIGSAGGELTTMSGGLTYTLTIPAGALQAPTNVTLTPIADQKHLPLSGGFVAGAEFQPAGLHLARPARLAITPLAGAPAGMTALAVAFEGDGDSLGLAPLIDSAGTAIMFLTHFSGGTIGFGTTTDVQLLSQGNPTGVASQVFLNQLIALGPPEPPGTPSALPILQAWFSAVVLPELQGAGSDAELTLAVGDFEYWQTNAIAWLTGTAPLAAVFGAPSLRVSGLTSEEDQAGEAVAPRLRAAITGNNAVCLSQHNFQAMLNVLYWQHYAVVFRVNTQAEQLDTATVNANICGHVVETSDTLAATLQAGFPHTLVVGFAVEADGTRLPGATEFEVSVTATGATIQNPAGNTDNAGFWGGSVVTAQGNDPVLIDARACVLDPATTHSTGVCGTASIARGSLDLTGTWTGRYRLSDDTLALDAPIELQITQVQNAIQGTFTVPEPNAPFGTISATLIGEDLANFTLDEGAPCGSRVITGAGRVVNGEIQIPHLSGPTCLGNANSNLVVTRVSGTPVDGLYLGSHHRSNNPGVVDAGGTVVIQFGDTLFFVSPDNFDHSTDAPLVSAGAVLSGTTLTHAGFTTLSCLFLGGFGTRVSCAIPSSTSRILTGTLSGGKLEVTDSVMGSPSADVFSLDRQ